MASDDFTDTDTTKVIDHDSNWQIAVTTVAGQNLYIISNQVRPVSFRSEWLYWSGSSEELSQVLFLSTNTTNQGAQVGVRMDDGEKGYCAVWNANSGGNWTGMQIQKSGNYFSGYTDLSYSQSSDHTVKITASGTSTVYLHAFVDGDDLGELTDSSSPLSAAYPGMGIREVAGNPTLTLDDWTDGVSEGFEINVAETFSSTEALD